MFTGIIKEIGTIQAAVRRGTSREILCGANLVVRGLDVGDSVCLNGVCLTITECTPGTFRADVVEETIRKTTIGTLKKGDKVNLEGALRAGDSIGGHFIQGHVDCVGILSSIRRTQKGADITVRIPESFTKLIVEKGSVSLDGVSLTIAGKIRKAEFTVSVIPHTMQHTIMQWYATGKRLNVEFDIIGKYVREMIGNIRTDNPLFGQNLEENGY